MPAGSPPVFHGQDLGLQLLSLFWTHNSDEGKCRDHMTSYLHV